MTNNRALAIVIAISLVLALSACGGQSGSKPAAPVPASKVSQDWKSDGVISEGEYAQSQKIGEVEVFSKIEGDSVSLALRAQTKGWLALGIEPEDKMKGADMIVGYVKDGQATVVDMYSTGVFGPHPADDKQSGASDITAVSGSLKDGVLVLEFKRKLNTGDSKDKPLKIGENKVIWAISDVPDITAKHGRRGAGTLILKQ